MPEKPSTYGDEEAESGYYGFVVHFEYAVSIVRREFGLSGRVARMGGNNVQHLSVYEHHRSSEA